ncbi:very short patch repair endonuclease [Nocardioides dongxiaopingii]|uniref:very short patch repair endonuclease n=1 Tax=Nocardioides dongxiaopingii TaxID=2576036 RepID=UPI001FE54193|nr:very short patch repair endonuclease [Nocardioides dongxiaopingii]
MASEPARIRPNARLSRKMSALARRDTAPEVLIRRELHRRGLRFRVQVKVPTNRRRTIDIAFTRVALAVFIDGCFWHGCPDHFSLPRANAEWWTWKIAGNQARDRDTDALLVTAGWTVLRFWEHQDPGTVADTVEASWREISARLPR